MKIASLYEQVTNAIIADLERGAPIWVQPWKTTRRTTLGFLPANLSTRRTYSGINIPILWHACEFRRNPATDSDLKPATVPI
jgi:antirestriction protein ArdC